MTYRLLTDAELWPDYCGTRKTTKSATAAEAAIESPPSNDCIEWTMAKDRYGYGKMQAPVATENGGIVSKQLKAHRYVCARVHGEPPAPDSCATHLCHNPSCINPNHLRWASHAENMADKVAAERTAEKSGEKNAWSKLTENDVREIRRLCGEGVSHHAIASDFGVTRAYISRINSKERWAHI